MKTFHITFYGRTIGAIGIVCLYHETVEAENAEAARLKLYDHYEDILIRSIRVEPKITMREFTPADFALAERVASRLGYKQTAYTSSSGCIGLFCINDRPTQKKGVIIASEEFGIMFVSDLEDLLMYDLDELQKNGGEL